MYAGAGDSPSTVKVRKLMEDKGVNKGPGRSWILLDNEVHSFTTLDRAHLETTRSYDELRRLSLEMICHAQMVDMVKQTPAYKNKLKALEMERSGGVTNKKKTPRNRRVEGANDLSKELDLQISGAEQPTIWRLLGVRFVLLPYTWKGPYSLHSIT